MGKKLKKEKLQVVVIEDDVAISTVLKYNLEQENFLVMVFKEGDSAIEYLVDNKPNLAIIDWMLPGKSGIEIVRELKKHQATSKLPIIFLTARGEEEDKVKGIDTGADDYMVKPFSVRELISRIYALLRRSDPSLFTDAIEYAGVTLSVSEHTIKYKNKSFKAGPTEFKMLKFFLENPAKVFSRQQLLDSIWYNSLDVELRTIDVHILRLRRILEDLDPQLATFLQTVRSFGYKFEKGEV